MDYKKELEEALERARNLESPFYRQAAEIIFPQLKENADEKIPRIIKKALDSYYDGKLSEGTNDTDYAECLAYIKKPQKFMSSLQEANKKIGELVEENYYLKEQKSPETAYNEELSKLLNKVVCRFINNPDIPYSERDEVSKKIVPYVERLEHREEESPIINKSVRKFKPGDFIIQQITNGTFTGQIVSIDTAYRVDGLDGSLYTIDFYEEPTARLWTMEDAKPGDILASEKSIFIFAEEYMAGKPRAYCGIMNGYFLETPKGCWTNEKCYPANKEQRKQLEKEMLNKGLEWHAEHLCLKPTNGHIFNVGDWCIDNIDGTRFEITKTENDFYTYRTLEGKEYSCSYRSLETDAHLWSIEDANSGDVLVYNDQYFIFKKMSSKNSFIAYCSYHYIGYDSICVDEKVSYSTENVKLATKEQREYLLSHLPKAGYVWRADKLKLVEVKPTTMEEKDRIDDAFTRMMLKESNQNSIEWTKSDDEHLSGIITLIEEISKDVKRDFRIVSEKERDNLIDWFKSLKEKITAYRQSIHNWSDKDGDMTRFIGNAITTDEASKYLEEKGVEVIDAHVWLDELKERTTPQDWSEYDSKMSSYIVAALDAYCRLRKERDNTSSQEELESAIHWIHNRFKYLKPNQEFVRDSKLIEEVCSYLNRYGNLLDERDSEYAAKIFKLADKLKSREVKSIWRPTPEQTSILWDAVCTLKHDNYKHTEIVESLYNELKKL
jgi:hypothetical protein